MQESVLFLNPPGKALYIRDYYCSKTSKAHYLPQPVDLLMQSGHFYQAGFPVSVCDAIVERLSSEETLARIERLEPALIITMCGAVSFKEDRSFFAALKDRLPQTRILASGDLFLDDPSGWLERLPWLSGIITNWFCDGSLRYALGDDGGVRGLIYRRDGRVVHSPDPKGEKTVSLPMPRHELFHGNPYRFAFADRYPMATVLTTYACPYPCTFCIMSQLGFRTRPVAEVLQELRYLKRLGISYLYFSDQTFFAVSEHSEELLQAMIDEQLNFNWCCFSRVDRLDERKLTLMKRAGCNVVMFGVEWADDALNAHYRKGYQVDQVRSTFALARKVGLRTLGTFLLGVPGETEDSILQTINLALELEADYASFNVAVPRARTAFREEALSRELVAPDPVVMDQSGAGPGMGTGAVSASRVHALKRRAYLRFYFRPTYLWRRLRGIGSLVELKTHVLEASHILKGLVTS